MLGSLNCIWAFTMYWVPNVGHDRGRAYRCDLLLVGHHCLALLNCGLRGSLRARIGLHFSEPHISGPKICKPFGNKALTMAENCEKTVLSPSNGYLHPVPPAPQSGRWCCLSASVPPSRFPQALDSIACTCHQHLSRRNGKSRPVRVHVLIFLP